MEKIKKLFLSEGFKYLFFGGLAFLVSAVVKLISFKITQSGSISEIISQVVGILFAFVTNKLWVFEKTNKNLWQEFVSFIGGRIALLLFSVFMNLWLIDQHPHFLMNLFNITRNQLQAALWVFLQVFIIIVNYLYSKFFVFKKKKTD